MARSLNAVQLIGNVGNDPEVRSTTGGTRVATLSLATSEQWKDAAGEKQERTQWHRLVVWGKLADVVEQYVTKGDKLFVAGSIDYRQWQDKEGQTRYSTEIKVRELLMLGGAKGAAGEYRESRDARRESRGTTGGTGSGAASGELRGHMAREKAGAGAAGKAAQRALDDDFGDFQSALADDDDDLPF